MPLPMMDFKLTKLIYIGLKLAELVLSAIYLGVTSYHTTTVVHEETVVYGHTKVISFIIVTAGFMVPTFLLLVVQFHAPSAEKQNKSIFEILFNVSAVVFLVAASTTMLSFTERLPDNFPGQGSWRAGGIMGLINTAFYSGSAILSFIEYRGSD